MKLTEYFKRYHTTVKKFADENKLCPGTVRNALSGHDIFASAARKIIKGCHGQVSLDELELGRKRLSRSRKSALTVNADAKDNGRKTAKGKQNPEA